MSQILVEKIYSIKTLILGSALNKFINKINELKDIPGDYYQTIQNPNSEKYDLQYLFNVNVNIFNKNCACVIYYYLDNNKKIFYVPYIYYRFKLDFAKQSALAKERLWVYRIESILYKKFQGSKFFFNVSSHYDSGNHRYNLRRPFLKESYIVLESSYFEIDGSELHNKIKNLNNNYSTKVEDYMRIFLFTPLYNIIDKEFKKLFK
jgi:hypothetical protein